MVREVSAMSVDTTTLRQEGLLGTLDGGVGRNIADYWEGVRDE